METRILKTGSLVVVALLTLVACSDPESKAQSAFFKVVEKWEEAQSIYDAERRLEVYNSVIEDLDEIAEDYSETPVGQTVARRGAFKNFSVRKFFSETDRLAERASCYSNLTIECLVQFSWWDSAEEFRSSVRSTTDSSQSRSRQSNAPLICANGFDEALAELENRRINKRLYADSVIQLGFEAQRCNNPDLVERAVAEYIEVEPLTGSAGVQKIASIINTTELKSGWQPAITVLREALLDDAIRNDLKSSIASSLMSAYAEIGEGQKALNMYKYITEELEYGVRIEYDTRLQLLTTSVAAQILEIETKRLSGRDKLSRRSDYLYQGIRALSMENGFPDTDPIVDSESQMLSVITSDLKALLDDAVIEAESFDSLNLGDGVYAAYALIGYLNARLGRPNAAKEAMEVSSTMRERHYSTRTSRSGNNQLREFSTAQLIVPLILGEPDAAAMVFRSLPQNLRQHSENRATVPKIIDGLVQKVSLEAALEFAAEADPRTSGSAYYRQLVDSLVAEGQLNEADELIASFPGAPKDQRALTAPLREHYVESGMPDALKDLQERYAALDDYALASERNKVALITAYVNAGDTRAAKTSINELFEEGAVRDSQDFQVNGREHFSAEVAASEAFEHGFIDLGFQLYRHAQKKSENPLQVALSRELSLERVKQALMLAHDHLSESDESIVVNYAMRRIFELSE